VLPRWIGWTGLVASVLCLLNQGDVPATAVPGFPVWDAAGLVGSTAWAAWVAALGDAATVLLAGIAAGRTTRPALLDWMSTYDAAGTARQIRFGATGDLTAGPLNVWAVTLDCDAVRADRVIAG
jgi:hypothetical protein